jgi:hypothetical protein
MSSRGYAVTQVFQSIARFQHFPFAKFQGYYFHMQCLQTWPPLWSSCHCSWLQNQRSRFLFPALPDLTASVVWWSEFLATDPEVRDRLPALPDFLRSSGSGTGSTQPREYNWGATWKKKSGSGLENRDYGRRDPSRWPLDTLYPQNLALTSLTRGGRSVGIVRHSRI